MKRFRPARQGDADTLLDKELRFHLDQYAADLVRQGVDPEEARRQAQLALGGVQRIRDECRDLRAWRWLDDLWQDARYAARALRRRPGFALIAVLTVALGTGATSVMFTLMNGVLLKPLPFPDSERLVALHERTDRSLDQWSVAYPTFQDVARDARTLQHVSAWTYAGGMVTAPGDAEYMAGRQISSELFAAIGVPLLRGRAFRADEDRPGGPPVALISERVWHARFAASNGVLGRPLVLDGISYTIVGVVPSNLPLDGDVDVFTPIGQNQAPRMRNRAARFLRVIARLRDGATVDDAQTELATIGRRLALAYPATNEGIGLFVQSLRREVTGPVSATLWLLFAAVSLVLLIACVNVVNLLLARALSRDRELAMRRALGAGRFRLLRQFLTESALLAVLGGGLGLAIAAVGTRPFIAFWPGLLPRADEVHVDVHVLLFAIAVSLLCAVGFGVAPVWQSLSDGPEPALRVESRVVSGRSRRVQTALVVAEIALACVVLVSAATIGRTLLRLSALDPGVDVRNVIVARLALAPGALGAPDRLRATWRDVLERARQVPGVTAAALVDVVPMRVGINSLGYWTTTAPPPPDATPIAVATGATPDYLAVMGIALRRGRFFTDHDRLGSEPVVVVDEVLARRAFGSTDVVGKQLSIQAVGPSRIVGVVGHVRHWGLAADDQSQIRDQIYYPLAQVPDPVLPVFVSVMSLSVRTSVAPLTLVEPLQRLLQEGSGATIYGVRTMAQLASASLDRHRFLLMLFAVFAGLSLLLACIGIYGVLAYVTGQRIPEFGVRMALGATSHDLVTLVLRHSAAMVVIGLGAGLLAAWAAGLVLGGVLEGVRPRDPVTFAVTALLVASAAVSASLIPALRASRIDPTLALKHE
jgi:predicted permease